MIDKKVTVKFWQLHPSPNGGAAFGDELRSALKVDLAGRVRELEGSLYQLDGESAQTGNVLLGEALRLQGEAALRAATAAHPRDRRKIGKN